MTYLRSLAIVIFSALSCAAIAPAQAGTVSLAWDPVTDPDLAGYRIYYDTTPQAFGESVEVGEVTAVTLSGLADCVDYYIAVKAFDSQDVESDAFSNVVSGWSRPRVTSVAPSELERNSTQQLTVFGANFRPAASVTFTDPAISVNSVTQNGCGQLLVNVTVGNAVLGTGDLEVINPDQTFGAGNDLFAVVDPSGPVISSLAASPVGDTTATISWTTDEPADGSVFFRRQGESTYQSGPAEATLVTFHQLQLQGLVPETTYEFYVQSADGDANTTSSTVQTLATAANSHTYIRFEAESGQLSSPVRSVSGGGAFRSAWIDVPTGTPTGTIVDPAGTAEYGFFVPSAGNWYVWVRVNAPSLQSDSWFEKVDGAVFAEVLATEIGAWHWVEARSYDLSQGLHTLTIGGREARARADRILVTDDPDFVPTEAPGDDVTPPDPVTGLAGVSGNGFVSLSWTHPVEPSLTVVVRYRADGVAPVSPWDGLPLLENPANPGGPGSVQHNGLSNGTTYHYSVFMVDGSGNASDPATVSATPVSDPPDAVQNLIRTDVR